MKALIALAAAFLAFGGAPHLPSHTERSPLSGRIAFFTEHDGGAGPPSRWEIYSFDLRTQEVERLTRNDVGDFDVSWSQSGSELVFARHTGGGVSPRLPNADIFVMAFGKGVERITSTRRLEAEPAISPDGTKIAFTRWGYDAYPPRAEIWAVDRDGSNPVRLTDSRPFGAGNAAWSPDGSRIAFISDRNGDPDLYVMNADGSDVRLLSGSEAWEEDPEWSPDGSTIAFARTPAAANKGGVFLVGAAGGAVTRLTSPEDVASSPAWSPEGTRLAFLGNRGDNPPWDLYVMDARPYAVWEPLLDSDSAGVPSWGP